MAALKGPVKQTRVSINWIDNEDESHTITSEDIVASIKKEAEGYYLASAIRKITLQLADLRADLLDARITINIQVKLADGTWGNLPWGSFNIYEAQMNEDKGTTTCTGYGQIYALGQQEYQESQITYPTTVAGLIEQVSSVCGIETETDTSTLPNKDAPITEDLWANINGTTYRDILEEIAGATGTMAVMNGGNDMLDFVKIPTTGASDTLTEANMITAKIGKEWGPANAVVLSRLPANDNIELADEEAIAEDGKRTDVQVANNEILDDQRETTIEAILGAVEGWKSREATIKTEGHGYHEVGDRIAITIDQETYYAIITKTSITVDGGINETLTATIPEEVAVDYSKAGGIIKTIYNTEIKVDKQNQEITSIVERQDQAEETTAATFTEIRQDIGNIVLTAQVAGGGNAIKNSVGFGKLSDGTLTNWTYAAGTTTANVRSKSSPSSLNAGAISGNEIEITNGTIRQTLNITAGEEYTLSAITIKEITGSGRIKIYSDLDNYSIEYDDQQGYEWAKHSVTFTPVQGTLTVEVTADENSKINVTDLILAQGGPTAWRQASGEIYNAQVSLDSDGVKVQSTAYTGDYVEITPLEFAGYSNASGIQKKVFSLNRETTEVEKLKSRSQISMPPLKIVPIDSGDIRGWAFVKES